MPRYRGMGMRLGILVLAILILQPLVSSAELQPINESTPGFSITPDNYDAKKVTVPLGPYVISFLTRLENVTAKGIYEPQRHNETAGSGMDYHICTYDLGQLWIYNNNSGPRDYPAFRFTIYSYIGPTSYQPVDPDPGGVSVISSWRDTATISRDYTGPDPLTVDGKKGTILAWWSIYHNEDYYGERHDLVGSSYYVVTYQPDDKTFVVLSTDNIVDYDKDVALVLQTLHISS